MPIIAAFAVASAALFLFAIGAAVRSRRSSVVSGREAMIGGSAEVQEAFNGRGLVRAFGELWQAESRVPVGKGSQVRIVAVKGLVLTVEPQE
jgi:membrane-bound serine protease (ClpP class)